MAAAATLGIGRTTRPSLLAIAAAFARCSSTSIGGGQNAAIRREVVRHRRWISETEYLELLAIAQLMPGANPTNVAVLIGGRLRGAPGAAVALTAAIVPGFAILLVLAAIALDVHLPAVAGALRACAAVAVGLTLANAIEMTWPRRTNAIDLAIVAGVAVSVTVFHLSLALALVIFVPLALLLTSRNTS